MPTLTLTGEAAQGLIDAVRTSMIETPTITPDVVMSLPAEMREKIFFAFMEELIRESGQQGLIPLMHSDGRSFGYIVPPEAAKRRHERLLAEMPADVRERHTRPLPVDFDINDTFDFDELFVKEPQRADAA